MADLRDIVAFCDQRLDATTFDDYCPNGLQVEGRPDVHSIVTGVTASQTLIDAAIDAAADLVLVHHGYFWRGEAAPLVGMKGQRVKTLMAADISLVAYHLPLDAHPELGNNRQLGLRLGLPDAAAVDGLMWGGEFARALSPDGLGALVSDKLGRAPLMVGPGRPVKRIAWCSGAAQGMIEQAAAGGFDAFISGEISEHTVHQARELGILYLAAGHHATERFGVQALGEELSAQFDLVHRFVDIGNPV